MMLNHRSQNTLLIKQPILVFLICVGLITGCNSNSTESQSSASFVSENVPPPSQLTRTVEHGMGETKVPETPQRIVTVESFTTESLLAIDVLPMGTVTPPPAYLENQLAQTESIGSPRPDLEQVLALQPDLILGTTYREEIYDQASQIAPTVLFEFESSANWKQIFASVGQAVNRSQAVEQVMEDYRDRLERFKEKIGNPGDLEVSVVRVYPDRFELYLPNTFAGTILEDAGLSRPPSQRGEQFVQRIGKEQLQRADGDVIFVWTYGNNSKAALEKLDANPLWSQLEAVQQGNVYQVNGSHWIGSGPIAANLIIDDLFRYLLEQES
jgi:iron complex transport system substrate-binding protein